MGTPQVKLIIGVPCQTARGVSPATFSSYARMVKPENHDLYVAADYHVVGARHAICDYAVEQDATHVLFLDSDMDFPPDTVARLMALDADIATILAWTKHIPSFPVTFRVTDSKDAEGRKVLQPYLGAGAEEIDTCGMACTLIRVGLLKRMAKPWFRLDDHFGEDAFFCLKAKHEYGAKIKCDFDATAGHLGFVRYAGQDFTRKVDERGWAPGGVKLLQQYGVLDNSYAQRSG